MSTDITISSRSLVIGLPFHGVPLPAGFPFHLFQMFQITRKGFQPAVSTPMLHAGHETVAKTTYRQPLQPQLAAQQTFSFGPHKDALLTVARVDYYYPFRHPV